MKVCESWLREFVNPAISTETLVEQLTMHGLEVAAVTDMAANFQGVVVAQVKEVQAHPNAERLKLCRVHLGGGELVSVVCGADNVGIGKRVAMARVGAVLPGNQQIEATSVRGITSQGMLCSAVELGLAEDAFGLLLLPDDAPLGAELGDYLKLDDRCIELELTPNRGDCLSVRGLAREVGAYNRCEVVFPLIQSVESVTDERAKVNVLAPDGCPRYVGCVIRNIDPKVSTPLWIRERLRRCGLRAINPIVDVTNYVMLELGQPLHAFDLCKLRGGRVVVRYAHLGEFIALLDGQTLELGPNTLVIADGDGAIALAGIMGGLDTAVDDGTRSVFLESAFFTPTVMAGKARRYRLQTDSSQRFERGVDYELPRLAAERATGLLIELCGGQAGELVCVDNAAYLPTRAPITLRRARVKRLLGIDLPASQVRDDLQRLGMSVEEAESGLLVTPPSFRFDVRIEADVIEEVVRAHGYQLVPSHVPNAHMSMAESPEADIDLARVKQVLVDRAYQEVVTYSFVDPNLQSKFIGNDEPIPLANPLSSEMAAMRTSLVPGLVGVLRHNHYRQQNRIRLFETGLVFTKGANKRFQYPAIGGIVSGPAVPEQWGQIGRDVDFFDLKGDVQALLSLSNGHQAVFRPAERAGLHPGQTAAIDLHGYCIGFLGLIHPAVVRQLELPGAVYIFQLQQAAVTRGVVPGYAQFSRLPTVRRDLSVVVSNEVTMLQLFECLRRTAVAELKDFQLFDLYQGKGIDSGEKSLSLGLIFQGISSNLIDSDVDKMVADILARLCSELGARLRE
ncbi:MAG: phenylalanine--tRNA ligase subunit beta [Gammaproteobacteria bacterium]